MKLANTILRKKDTYNNLPCEMENEVRGKDNNEKEDKGIKSAIHLLQSVLKHFNVKCDTRPKITNSSKLKHTHTIPMWHTFSPLTGKLILKTSKLLPSKKMQASL